MLFLSDAKGSIRSQNPRAGVVGLVIMIEKYLFRNYTLHMELKIENFELQLNKKSFY